jgi:hypothetical protein
MFIFPNASNSHVGKGEYLMILGVDWAVISKNNIPVQFLCKVI